MRILYIDLPPEKFVHTFLACIPDERRSPIQIPPTIFHSAFYAMMDVRSYDFLTPELKGAFELDYYGISPELKRFLQSAKEYGIIATRDEWTFNVLICPDAIYGHAWPRERAAMHSLTRDFFRRSDGLLEDFLAQQKTHA